jgi:hypothetical protein
MTCASVHAGVPDGTACGVGDDNGKPVGAGVALGDGDGEVAQLARTMANAKALIVRTYCIVSPRR